ncbi:SDR family oxidoreductase [Kitasatospora viridis]|uniref:3-oxoacyl-[acyl-carrier protein] reductase n=1 Tax=Kitasatospora viridis TaxID=281105 RepID=A0A561UQH1_9ACTN|nr:SDR family oxidoreductase [Kitasatospora viridis]TWG01605.1 3-oxoacyl-[acyl-carrier protein] reductase [Kitasatospora viridis]
MLKGKTAVVTGGSRGIGRAIVERLRREGAEVVFSYASSADAAREIEAEVGAHPIRAELSDPAEAERLMAEAQEHLGGLDILVNNAAPTFALTTIAETELAEFDRILTVNARSAFLTIRHAARSMRDGGRIVNVSTANTFRSSPKIAPYAASKGALEQLTRVAALELGRRGITVNTVSPGATDTDMLRHTADQPILDAAAAMTPLGRLGEPADVADVVAFLVGPDGRWMTGQNLRATGGLA